MIGSYLTYVQFVGGLLLFIGIGFLWSHLLFKDMSLAGRLSWGFGISIVSIASFTMLLATVVTVTPLGVYVLTGIYAAIPACWLLITKPKLKIPWPNKTQTLRLVMLVGILAFVAFITYLPHLDNNYALPFHADEWVHWGYTRTFMEEGSLQFPSPFTGEENTVNPEIGFHVFLSCFKWLSGASLQTLFLYLPSAIAVLTALAAFALGEQHEMKFGLGAAFFVSFIPTTVRFLGPSFLVPVAVGLFLVLIALLMVRTEGRTKYPLVFLLVLFTAIMHSPSAVAMAIVLLSYACMLLLERRFRSAGLLALTTALPFLASYFVIPQLYFEQGISVLFGEEYTSQLGAINLELQTMSSIVWGLFFLGSFMALWKGRAVIRSLVAATVGFLVVVVAYGEFGFGLPILYDRFFSYIFLGVTIIAGLGLAAAWAYMRRGLRELAQKMLAVHKRREVVLQGGSIAVVVVLCIGAVAVAIPVQQDEDFYTIINEEEFDRYLWIQHHLGDYRGDVHPFLRAAVEPNKAGPFSAVSGVYTVANSFWPLYGQELKNVVRDFLHSNGSDPAFIEQQGIGVIVANMTSSLMQKIYDNVYLYYGTPPTANYNITPMHPAVETPITFTSTATTPYGRITDWQWDFGDGTVSNGSITGLQFADNQSIQAEVSMNSSFTISIWLRPHFDYDDGKTHQWFVWRGENAYIACYKHSNDRVYFVVRKDNWRAATSIIPFQAGQWHHVAVTYTAGGLYSIYWDGKFEDLATGGDSIIQEEGTMRLGGSTNSWFNGTIRDIKIYDYMLTPSEVKENTENDVINEGLVSWWPLCDGGEIAYDQIGNMTFDVEGAKWLNQAVHVFDEPGEYTVTLTVQNEDGLQDTVIKTVMVE